MTLIPGDIGALIQEFTTTPVRGVTAWWKESIEERIKNIFEQGTKYPGLRQAYRIGGSTSEDYTFYNTLFTSLQDAVIARDVDALLPILRHGGYFPISWNYLLLSAVDKRFPNFRGRTGERGDPDPSDEKKRLQIIELIYPRLSLQYKVLAAVMLDYKNMNPELPVEDSMENVVEAVSKREDLRDIDLEEVIPYFAIPRKILQLQLEELPYPPISEAGIDWRWDQLRESRYEESEKRGFGTDIDMQRLDPVSLILMYYADQTLFGEIESFREGFPEAELLAAMIHKKNVYDEVSHQPRDTKYVAEAIYNMVAPLSERDEDEPFGIIDVRRDRYISTLVEMFSRVDKLDEVAAMRDIEIGDTYERNPLRFIPAPVYEVSVRDAVRFDRPDLFEEIPLDEQAILQIVTDPFFMQGSRLYNFLGASEINWDDFILRNKNVDNIYISNIPVQWRKQAAYAVIRNDLGHLRGILYGKEVSEEMRRNIRRLAQQHNARDILANY